MASPTSLIYLLDMSRPTRTRLAVLGVIAVEPASGYAIRESIRSSIGHFWSESFGQIYPVLNELADQGFIEVERTDARNSKVFRITDSGRSHLHELLLEDFTPQPPRDETLLRLFFGRFLGVPASVSLLRDSVAANEELLAHLVQLRRTLEVEYADSPDLRYWVLTVRGGEYAAEAKINWAREAMAALEGGAP